MARGRDIPGLDGLRAISVGLVVMGHALEVPGLPRAIAYPRVLNAALGVSIFFAISGYLITTLLLDEERRDGVFSLKRFYVRRAFRILPAAMTYLAVLCVVSAMWPVSLVTGRDLISCVFFFRNYVPDGSVLTGHYWSLAVEEQFYAVCPAVLLVLPRRFLLPAVVAWILVAPLWINLCVKASGGVINPFRFDFRIDQIFVGVALALAYRAPWCRDAVSWLSTRGALAFWVGVAWLVVSQVAADSPRHGATFVAGYAADLALVLVLVGAISGPGAIVAAVLENAGVRFVGRLSYSLYLWQQLFFKPDGWLGGAPRFVHFPEALVPAFGLACASYFCIEKPFLALRTRWQSPPARLDASVARGR